MKNDPQNETRQPTCPVVAIGASAGGVEALGRFFRAVPAHSGIAYVVVQHLDPTRHSMLAELLNRISNVQVVEVSDEPEIRPDRVWVIPPDSTLTIRKGRLHIETPVESRGRRMPIDHFFRSMAQECGERGIGVILSGGGADGTLGLKDIKAAGGMVMVQDPNEAEQDSMPRSAIATGLVDYVLPVAEMPREIIAFVRHPYLSQHEDEQAEPDQDGIGEVLDILREHKEYDFRAYKPGTITRRIQRRMSINHVAEIGEYVRILKHNKVEIDELFHDLFIGVTSFFREPDAWTTLAEDALPEVLRGCLDDSKPFRVWVPGCSTGEEAYTAGMVVREQFRAAKAATDCQLQIFGSDVDKAALEKGRDGLYPEAIVEDVPAEYLQRYFTKSEDGHHYRVAKHLREQIVFAHQNLLADPPFSRLDLICCRNLLIYLLPKYHRDVLALFHFALKPGGCLFLGSAETVGRHQDLFQPISQKWRIYRRVGGHHHHDMVMPIIRMRRHQMHREGKNVGKADAPNGGTVFSASQRSANSGRGAGMSPAHFADWARQILVSRYAPTCVLIDGDGQVLYFSGATHDYLVQPLGLPTRDIFALSREGLGPKLQAAVAQARESRGPVSVDDAIVRRGRDFVPIKFVVLPLSASEGGEDRMLIAFEDAEPTAQDAVSPSAERKRIEQLQTELEISRAELSAAIQRLDTSHEDHRASNEELMSMNEELQSTNEELETSKEELQSLNEELATVNQQVQHKVEELEEANDDLTNLLTSTELATIFLDMEFRIMWFTPAMRKLLNLLPTDIGRPITDFSNQVLGDDMIDKARQVLNDRKPIEQELQSPSGEWYLRRVLPYLREESKVDGVVITFTNITQRKKTEEHQSMLIAELDHRVKNTLATVATLASQTMRSSTSLEEFGEKFEGRIQALSRAHMLMTRSRWHGTDVRSVLNSAVEPYTSGRPGAARLEGPQVLMPARVAVSLMMVFHELATNAAKYGAFSKPGGRVEVEWQLHDDAQDEKGPQLIMRWQECDGPRVTAQDPGFGTRFIQRTVEHELQGSVDIQFRPSGVYCEMRLPWREHAQFKGEGGVSARPAST